MPIVRPNLRRISRLLAVGLTSLAAATFAVAVLEEHAGVPNASSVYLVAVAVTAIAAGTAGAIPTALASIVVYDVLFTEPRYELTVADPGEWVTLVVLLFVGVTVGQLAALQRRRAELALAHEREARAIFDLSRAFATRATTAVVLPAVARTLQQEARVDRAWFVLGTDGVAERIVADSGEGAPPSHGGSYAVLRRDPGAGPATWVRIHEPSRLRGLRPSSPSRYRVRIESDGAAAGSVWAARARDAGDPDPNATRLLAVVADQVGQALAHDRLAEKARQAEVARQADALKSALLESVSHDLRTPLAAIRAAAGTLMDEDVRLSQAEARASARSIDRQAERLDRIVTNLLDLGRIEGGGLRTAHEIVDLDDVVARAIAQVHRAESGHSIEVDIPDPIPIRGDPVLLEEVLLNVIENGVRHTPPGTRVLVSAIAPPAAAFVRLTVEDAGPGVPPELFPRLFEKFFAVPQRGSHPRGGGLGLAVVRGLTEAMGGHVTARRSRLGGLAIDLDLPLAQMPAGIAVG